eukprot:g1412.t1
MAPKRGHWQRKKEERSRSFAKRGRVGGFGAYGHEAQGAAAVDPSATPAQDTAAAPATAGAGNANGPAAKKKRPGNHRGTRRVETVHDGSYAGELGALLSEERRKLLKKRFEEDDKKAMEEKEEKEEKEKGQAAASPSADAASVETKTAVSDPAAGPNREGGVASSTSKKKVALLISYWGSDYQGLQMNKGARTIEAELEIALYLAGAISKDNFGNPRKIGWSCSGRTDKGVHAAAQVISLKLTYPNDGEKEMVEAINSYLPRDIRAIDIKRAPKSFDSRTRCSGRRYEYIMPTFVLAPKEHIAALFEEALEWEKSQGGSGDGNTAAVADNSAETVSAAKAAVGAAPTTSAGLETAASNGGAAGAAAGASGSSSEVSVEAETGATAAPAAAAGAGPEHALAGAPEMGASYSGRSDAAAADDDDDGYSDGDGSQPEAQEEHEGNEARLKDYELSSPAVVRRVAEKLEGYRLPPDRMEALREILKGFLGTKSYHNYTNHKQATDPSCKRFITACEAADPFEDDGVQWVRLTIMGQSFILHQIRKMVASTVDRVRGHSNEEDFTKTFFDDKMALGIAPSDGLYLERPLYEPYNAHAKRTGAEDRALEWESGPAAERVERFKKESIHAGILAQEKVDHEFVAWLDRITRYPCTYDTEA